MVKATAVAEEIVKGQRCGQWAGYYHEYGLF